MANDTIGDSNTLQFDIPQKGNKDWSQVIKDAFKDIAAHDHTEGGKGAKLGPSGIEDNAVQIEHKKTYEVTLGSGAATTLTGVTVTDDQAIKLNYRIHNTGTTTAVQVGTLTGQAGDYLVDEFIGTDIGAKFSWSGNNLQLTGALNDKITYSIEFLE